MFVLRPPFSAIAAAQGKTFDPAELERVIEAELKHAKRPGAAVAVVSGDKVIFPRGFGTTRAEGGTPASPDTLFRMGSTTKMFTSAAVLMLAETRKGKMTAPVGNYVKDLLPHKRKIKKLLITSAGAVNAQGPEKAIR